MLSKLKILSLIVIDEGIGFSEKNTDKILDSLSKQEIDEAYSIISNWKNYLPTPF